MEIKLKTCQLLSELGNTGENASTKLFNMFISYSYLIHIFYICITYQLKGMNNDYYHSCKEKDNFFVDKKDFIFGDK